MEKQMSFAQAEYAGKKKMTRREKFLKEMEQVVPWARLVAVIEPHYPKGMRGRPPIGIERMLRIYFLQQWYALADEALEDAIYDSQVKAGDPSSPRWGLSGFYARVVEPGLIRQNDIIALADQAV